MLGNIVFENYAKNTLRPPISEDVGSFKVRKLSSKLILPVFFGVSRFFKSRLLLKNLSKNFENMFFEIYVENTPRLPISELVEFPESKIEIFLVFFADFRTVTPPLWILRFGLSQKQLSTPCGEKITPRFYFAIKVLLIKYLNLAARWPSKFEHALPTCTQLRAMLEIDASKNQFFAPGFWWFFPVYLPFQTINLPRQKLYFWTHSFMLIHYFVMSTNCFKSIYSHTSQVCYIQAMFCFVRLVW